MACQVAGAGPEEVRMPALAGKARAGLLRVHLPVLPRAVIAVAELHVHPIHAGAGFGIVMPPAHLELRCGLVMALHAHVCRGCTTVDRDREALLRLRVARAVQRRDANRVRAIPVDDERCPRLPGTIVDAIAQARQSARRVRGAQLERHRTDVPAARAGRARPLDGRDRRSTIVPQRIRQGNRCPMVGVARAVAQPGIDGVLALAGHAQAVQQLARRVEGPVGRAGGRAVEAHVDPGDAGLVQRHAPRQIEGVLLLPAGRPGGQVRRRGRRIRVEPQRRLPEGFEVACDVLCRVLQAVLARRVERELRARVRGRHPLAAVQPVAQLRHTGVGVLRAQHHCKRRAIPTSLTGQALDRMGGRRRRRVIAQERRDCTVARISVAGPVAQPKIQTVRAFVRYAEVRDAVGGRQQFAVRRACRFRV